MNLQNIFMRIASILLAVTPILYCKNIKGLKCKTKTQTNTFLWSLKRDPPAYFFGTIHVPYTRVWEYIPKSSKRAFKRSDEVFFELDLTNPYTVADLIQCQMLPRGSNLREILTDDLYRRMQEHLNYIKTVMPDWVTSEQKEKGLYADILYEAIVGNWEKKKPIWLLVMISSLTKMEVRSRGSPVLDFHLARKALEMSKKIGAVENVSEQCQPLNRLNLSHVVEALNKTLAMQEEIRWGRVQSLYSTENLIDQYNCGELDTTIFDQIPKLSNNTILTLESDVKEKQTSKNLPGAKLDSYFKKELIYLRNERMAERVIQHLNASPNRSFFFAFGTGHFLGNHSIINYLRKRGYKIENVRRKENIKPTFRKASTQSGLKRKKIQSRLFRRWRKQDRLKKSSKRSRRLKKNINHGRSTKMISKEKNMKKSHFTNKFMTLQKEKLKLRRNSLIQEHFRLIYSNSGGKIKSHFNRTSRPNATGGATGVFSFLNRYQAFVLTVLTYIIIYCIV